MAIFRDSAFATLPGLHCASLLLVFLILSACTAAPLAPARPQALLLVSLDDGSIIRQSVDIDADVCMKANSESATTCFTRGAPIFDANHVQIIGYRMERSEISLFAQ